MKNTNYFSIFADKHDRMVSQIKQLLGVPKKERNRKMIKNLLRDARRIRKTLKKMKPEPKCCPHCGGVIGE